MKIGPRFAAVSAVAAIALAGPAIGTAMAASHGSATHASVARTEPTGPDHDSLQQGDQTGQDQTGGPDHVSAVAVRTASSPEHSSSEGESSTESESGPSDGPGGHADPSGNVQNEFSGVQ